MCPKCSEPLIVVEFQGVEVDRCLACRGTWLDAGELEFISELAGVEPGRLERALCAVGEGEPTRRRCPRCGRKLRAVVLGQDPAVEVDRCPVGDGLWLDAGELATIVRSLSDSEDAVVAEFLGDLFHHEKTEPAEEH